MVWLWLLFPLLILGVALALWRAAIALGEERAGLASEVRALGVAADQARRVADPDPAGGATGRPQIDR